VGHCLSAHLQCAIPVILSVGLQDRIGMGEKVSSTCCRSHENPVWLTLLEPAELGSPGDGLLFWSRLTWVYLDYCSVAVSTWTKAIKRVCCLLLLFLEAIFGLRISIIHWSTSLHIRFQYCGGYAMLPD